MADCSDYIRNSRRAGTFKAFRFCAKFDQGRDGTAEYFWCSRQFEEGDLKGGLYIFSGKQE